MKNYLDYFNRTGKDKMIEHKICSKLSGSRIEIFRNDYMHRLSNMELYTLAFDFNSIFHNCDVINYDIDIINSIECDSVKRMTEAYKEILFGDCSCYPNKNILQIHQTIDYLLNEIVVELDRRQSIIDNANEVKSKKKEPLKKVFISVPFSGREDKNVINSINKMHALAEIVFGQELEPVHNFFIKGQDAEIIAPEGCNESIYYLSYAIEKMSYVDYFIGVPTKISDFKTCISRGCKIENMIAESYCIPMKILSLDELPSVAPDLYGNL